MSNEVQKIILVPFDDVAERAGFNSRTQFGDMDGLKASLLADGWNDAVDGVRDLATEGKWLLGPQGHRRRRAVTELIAEGHKTDAKGRAWVVPIREEADDVTEEERRIRIITLNTGKPLELIEEARVFHAIVSPIEDKNERNEKIRELAEKTGRSRTHIVKGLSLLEAPKTIQKLVEKGSVAGTTVIELFEEKKDWSKVENAVVSAMATAQSKGKTKVTKKTLAVATREEKEQAEEEKAAKEAVKARHKELTGYEKRALRLAEEIKEWVPLKTDDANVDKIEDAVTDLGKRVASYVIDTAATKASLNSSTEYGEASSIGDIRIAANGISKLVKQIIKEIAIENRNAQAEMVKAHKEELAEAVKAAKATKKK